KLWTDVTLSDEGGVPVTQLARGATVRFDGQVLDHPGGSPVAMDGVASLLIEDAAPSNLTPNECAPPLAYVFSAGPMYHGDVTIKAGHFSGRFVVPLDATTGTTGRVRAYFSGRDASGEQDGV